MTCVHNCTLDRPRALDPPSLGAKPPARVMPGRVRGAPPRARASRAARPAYGIGTGSPVTARRPFVTGAASWVSASSSVLRSELTSRSSGSVPPTV
jgi:hypothetical protein